jgi:NaMN:DMB phosphoribosyltransferase
MRGPELQIKPCLPNIQLGKGTKNLSDTPRLTLKKFKEAIFQGWELEFQKSDITIEKRLSVVYVFYNK